MDIILALIPISFILLITATSIFFVGHEIRTV